MLVALCVRGFKKIYPQQCWLLFAFVGSKKYTRDVSEVVTLFMGSKECIRDSAWLLFAFAGSKKMHPRCRCRYGCVYGLKKIYPRC